MQPDHVIKRYTVFRRFLSENARRAAQQYNRGREATSQTYPRHRLSPRLNR
jgi:hypothetical protein